VGFMVDKGAASVPYLSITDLVSWEFTALLTTLTEEIFMAWEIM
jgi:hypothetical protein